MEKVKKEFIKELIKKKKKLTNNIKRQLKEKEGFKKALESRGLDPKFPIKEVKYLMRKCDNDIQELKWRIEEINQNLMTYNQNANIGEKNNGI